MLKIFIQLQRKIVQGYPLKLIGYAREKNYGIILFNFGIR